MAKILSIRLSDNEVLVDLSNGLTVTLSDEGQNCCEDRYITTDDDLPSCVGSEYLGWHVAAGPTVDDPQGEVHEIEFLRVETSGEVITFETHNVHNGSYSGFQVVERITGAT